MATGYEVGMYRDIERIAKNSGRIATALERIADVLEKETADPEEESTEGV